MRLHDFPKMRLLSARHELGSQKPWEFPRERLGRGTMRANGGTISLRRSSSDAMTPILCYQHGLSMVPLWDPNRHYAGESVPVMCLPSRSGILGCRALGQTQSPFVQHAPRRRGGAAWTQGIEWLLRQRRCCSLQYVVRIRKRHGSILISPLGNLSKEKPDGSITHRIIQDLRRGGASLLAELFERIVLPRPNDHGWGLYNLWKALANAALGPEASVWSLIVDFEDAFMSTGTLASEQKYTAAKFADPSSPTGWYYYVWHTLGLGGKTFPLVYARPASFAARSAQALLNQDLLTTTALRGRPCRCYGGHGGMCATGRKPSPRMVVGSGAQALLGKRLFW